ncbi:MAG: SET domain-containing protein [Candidatus Paceibacterota bacterium]
MKDVLVKKSKINGKGVFANKNFRKGAVIIKWKIGKIFTKREIDSFSKEIQKYKNHIGRNKYIIAGSPEGRVNHSCLPNTFVKNGCDIALRGIKKGEEITSDYTREGASLSFICNCGQKNCKKKIIKK